MINQQRKKPNFFAQFTSMFKGNAPSMGQTQNGWDSMNPEFRGMGSSASSNEYTSRGLGSNGEPMQREDGSFASQEEIDSWEVMQANQKYLRELGKKAGMSKKEMEKAGASEIMERYSKSPAAAKDEKKRQEQFQTVTNQEGSGGNENISFLEKLRRIAR